MAYKVLVLKGDGIGPEVVGEALQVLKVVARRDAVDLEFKEGVIGGHAIDASGTPLPPNTLAAAKDCDAILLGAVGGPKWDNPKADVRPEQALLGLRKELGLFANLRPARMFATSSTSVNSKRWGASASRSAGPICGSSHSSATVRSVTSRNSSIDL